MTEQDFFAWEAKSKDTIDFKTIYVDIAGDIVAGLYLSQCVFWHLPNIHGGTKLRIERDGKLWIARADAEWYKEIRLTAKQARRARESLCEKKIMESRIFKFDGTPKCHVRVIMPALMAAINRILLDEIDLPSKANGQAPEGNPSSPVGRPSFTENTTETTAESHADAWTLQPFKDTKTSKKKPMSIHPEYLTARALMIELDNSFMETKTLREQATRALKNHGLADVLSAIRGRAVLNAGKTKHWSYLFSDEVAFQSCLGRDRAESKKVLDMKERFSPKSKELSESDIETMGKKLSAI